MFGSFANELEIYRFFDWLEFDIAPRKKVPPQEANEKAHFYTFSLRIGRGNDDAIKLLTIFRQHEADKNHPSHNDDQQALSFEPAPIS